MTHQELIDRDNQIFTLYRFSILKIEQIAEVFDMTVDQVKAVIRVCQLDEDAYHAAVDSLSRWNKEDYATKN